MLQISDCTNELALYLIIFISPLNIAISPILIKHLFVS